MPMSLSCAWSTSAIRWFPSLVLKLYAIGGRPRPPGNPASARSFRASSRSSGSRLTSRENPGRDVGHVQLPGHVFVVARDLGRDDAEHHAVEERRTAEVLREALQDHLVVATPRDEPKGARADRVTGEAGAAPVDLLTRDDRGGIVCDQGKEGCERLIEVKLHREIVDDAYSRDVARVARDEGACAGDLLDHPGPLALGGPLERVLHVGRCERAAVVEANAIPQQERVG